MPDSYLKGYPSGYLQLSIGSTDFLEEGECVGVSFGQDIIYRGDSCQSPNGRFMTSWRFCFDLDTLLSLLIHTVPREFHFPRAAPLSCAFCFSVSLFVPSGSCVAYWQLYSWHIVGFSLLSFRNLRLIVAQNL